MSLVRQAIRKPVALVGGLAVTASIVAVLMLVSLVGASSTYTTNADFDQGVLLGVEHTTVSDQLQLSSVSSTFPFMWIANAGENTLSKIDTNTGRELARYRTYFDEGFHDPWSSAAPSRSAVDSDGNVYVANRHFWYGRQPSVVKILSSGGIDRNGNALIDTSSDTDNSGTISLSTETMPLLDANSNGVVETSEIQDERVVWVAQAGGGGQLGRSLCLGTDGNLWLGTYNDGQYYKLSSATGAVIGGPVAIGLNPYGCAVDGQGRLWSASLGDRLGLIDTTLMTSQVFYHAGQDYGIVVGGNGHVLQANLSGYSYSDFDPISQTFSYPAYSKGVGVCGIGIGVDGTGNIFLSGCGGDIYKFLPDGTLLCYAPPQVGGWYNTRGAVIDSNGNVWLNHNGSDNISEFRGTDCAPLGVFPVGHGPYTYSDATGIGALSTTSPTGFWTVVNDGGAAGATWGTVSWNGATPAGTTLEVKVRASDTLAGLDLENYAAVSSGVPFSATGRYIQIQVKFVASQAGVSPILYDLTVEPTVQVPPTATPTPPTPTPTLTPTPVPDGRRMTGGGTIGAKLATHGMELHCDVTKGPNNLEVNWGTGKKFHLDILYAAVCSDDPAIVPNPPQAGFDTYKGKGSGSYNGVAGATAEWTFTDAGEPGKKDYATIKITDAGSNVVLNASGNLSSGNQQAHKD